MAETVFFILRKTVLVLFSALDIFLLLRALFSWFDPMGEGTISNFLIRVTEPVILPFRALCEHFHWFENVPVDIPFLMTWITLSLIQVLVSYL